MRGRKMNIVKKIYCRSVQSMFRIILPILPYKNPQILNSINNIPKLAKYAANEANPLYPVPVLMDEFELEKIYMEVKK